MIEPNLVTSGLSQKIEVDGVPFSINICRMEHETTWTLALKHMTKNELLQV